MRKSTAFLCLIAVSFSVLLHQAKTSEASLRRNSLDENSSHKDSTSTSEIPTKLPRPSDSTPTCSESKHEEYCECRKNGLVAYEPNEYVIRNGTVHILPLNVSYSSLFYELDGDDLLICKLPYMNSSSVEDTLSQHSKVHVYITLIGMIISIVCLSLHLLCFALVPDLRNIPGCCMACLCVSLLCGYVSFLVGFDEYILDSRGPCIAAAFSTHFFLLSSLFWTNVISFDVLKSLLNAAGKLIRISSKMAFKNFYAYCLYAWGISLGFAIAAVLSDNAKNFPEEYKPHFGDGMCWFQRGKAVLLFFAAPVFTLICMNVIFFGVSIYIITSHTMKPTHPQRGILKKNLIMYSRLAVIMGLTWVSGLLASVLNKLALWYISALLNTLQGFFIFVAFTCTPKVKKQFKERFGSNLKKHSVQTTSGHDKASDNVRKISDFRTTERI